MAQTVLELSELTFAYRDGARHKQVLNNISLELRSGEIVCLLGPSGCGKTTLLDLVAGLVSPDSGSIRVMGGSQTCTQIGYIFQHDALMPWRTVYGNLMIALDLNKSAAQKADIDRLLADYLSTFHLDTSILTAYPSHLSGGMRQRVSIIQALMFNPQILLLDEPFSALDFYTKLRLEGEFRTLAKQHQKSTLLVTHDIDEAIAMADRVLIMDETGSIKKEIPIDLQDGAITPEQARGSPLFSTYYNTIWSELRAAIVG